jgi:hypothetical protein
MSSNRLDYFPKPQEFLIDIPIYKGVDVKLYSYEYSHKIEYPDAAIDAFCIECGLSSVFNADNPPITNRNFDRYKENFEKDKDFDVILRCSRNSNHEMRFYFAQRNGILMKVGQLPSIADLLEHRVGKYRNILGDKYIELTRAIGLASHGIGIGSYVYLRRVFERLIEEAYERAKDTISKTPIEFQQLPMQEKIKLLKEYLPKILVSNSNVYSILSKGIHDLGEDECLDNYSVIEKAIELILDEEIERKDHLEKEKQITTDIGNIVGKIRK